VEHVWRGAAIRLAIRPGSGERDATGRRAARMRFEKIWIEQCGAAAGIRERFGVEAAVDYLIGEKLPAFAEAAATRPNFARELPAFVGEARRLFSRAEIAVGLARLEASTQPPDIDAIDEPDFRDTTEQHAAQRARIDLLRTLLMAERLGTA
jgi:hypothetical protein